MFNNFNPFRWQLKMLSDRHPENTRDESIQKRIEYLNKNADLWDQRRQQMYISGSSPEKFPHFLSGVFTIPNQS